MKLFIHYPIFMQLKWKFKNYRYTFKVWIFCVIHELCYYVTWYLILIFALIIFCQLCKIKGWNWTTVQWALQSLQGVEQKFFGYIIIIVIIIIYIFFIAMFAMFMLLKKGFSKCFTL